MSYTSWAVRLIRHFFGPQFADQRVRLLVTRNILDENFPDLGGFNGFVQAVQSGPEWFSDKSDTLYSRGNRLFRQWKHTSIRPSAYPRELVELHDAPPFLTYLCLLCLAWTEGDSEAFAANAFYSRLERLCSHHELRNHLGDWLPLW